MSSENLKLSTASEVLKVEKEVSVLTSGCSMQPMLRQHRDVVTVKRVDRELRKGDAVLYPGKDGRFILHRIVKIKNGEFIIRGDNNYFTEYGIKKENIVGLIKEFYRDGKYINCETDLKYKLYVFYICHSYAMRYFWRNYLRPTLGKVKRFILRKKVNL